MPLNLPDKLPAIELLKEENIFVIDNSRASSQDIRPLKIVILNLMPIKITTETDLVRLLSNTPLQLEITFMKLKSHTSKNTPIEHMQAFYHDFDILKSQKFDGMIITGAPVEQMPFEDVNYWEEITEVFNWAHTHVTSTLYICWAAQAGLYHFYGVPKYPLDKKMFGIFQHRINVQGLPIFRGFDDEFFVPHSRHTEIRREDILKVNDFNRWSKVPLEQWIYFLNTGEIPEDANAPGLPEARERLKLDRMSKAELAAYYKHLDNVVILRDNIVTARGEGRLEGIAEGRIEGIAEGRLEGIAEGRIEGIAEGRAEGITEGRNEAIHENALRMRTKGYPIEDIAEITGLPIEEIEKL